MFATSFLSLTLVFRIRTDDNNAHSVISCPSPWLDSGTPIAEAGRILGSSLFTVKTMVTWNNMVQYCPLSEISIQSHPTCLLYAGCLLLHSINMCVFSRHGKMQPKSRCDHLQSQYLQWCHVSDAIIPNYWSKWLKLLEQKMSLLWCPLKSPLSTKCFASKLVVRKTELYTIQIGHDWGIFVVRVLEPMRTEIAMTKGFRIKVVEVPVNELHLMIQYMYNNASLNVHILFTPQPNIPMCLLQYAWCKSYNICWTRRYARTTCPSLLFTKCCQSSKWAHSQMPSVPLEWLPPTWHRDKTTPCLVIQTKRQTSWHNNVACCYIFWTTWSKNLRQVVYHIHEPSSIVMKLWTKATTGTTAIWKGLFIILLIPLLSRSSFLFKKLLCKIFPTIPSNHHLCGGLKTLYVLWSRVKQVSLFKFPYRFPQWQLLFSDLDLSTFAELLLLVSWYVW